MQIVSVDKHLTAAGQLNIDLEKISQWATTRAQLFKANDVVS